MHLLWQTLRNRLHPVHHLRSMVPHAPLHRAVQGSYQGPGDTGKGGWPGLLGVQVLHELQHQVEQPDEGGQQAAGRDGGQSRGQ